MIHRRDVFKASTIMYERAANHPKIEIKTFRQIKEWLSDDKGLSGAVLENPLDGSTETIEATGAFIAIGHTPITDFLGNQVETDDEGYILHKEHTMTSVPGVFAAGDVVDTLQTSHHRCWDGLFGGHGRRKMAGRARPLMPFP